MDRRSFLGALCAAPIVAAPVIAKSASAKLSALEVGQIDASKIVASQEVNGFVVTTDEAGHISGFRLNSDPIPAFTVKTIDGVSRVVVRTDYIDHLHGMAARQNESLI